MTLKGLPVNNKLYQIFLLKSAVPIPLNFAMHGWFLLNRKGEIDRWEFGKFSSLMGEAQIGVMHDYLRPTEGMNKYGWKRLPRADSKLMCFIEGSENSLAYRMTKFIQNRSEEYPFKGIYNYIGPNSNTYLQWVINHFPESGFILPWNAFGKNYFKIKQEKYLLF